MQFGKLWKIILNVRLGKCARKSLSLCWWMVWLCHTQGKSSRACTIMAWLHVTLYNGKSLYGWYKKSPNNRTFFIIIQHQIHMCTFVYLRQFFLYFLLSINCYCNLSFILFSYLPLSTLIMYCIFINLLMRNGDYVWQWLS